MKKRRRGRSSNSRDKIPVKEGNPFIPDKVELPQPKEDKYKGHDKYPDLVNNWHPSAFS